MCGLMGLVANSGKSSVVDVKQVRLFVETALLIGATRGRDGTGLAVVFEEDAPAEIYKEAIPGWNFLESKTWQGIESNVGLAQAVLVHNRKTTVGGNSYANTQPFQRNGVTLEHNGTLRRYSKQFVTDSDYLCDMVATSKNLAETLEDIDGAFALNWHDSRTGKVYLARNHERPLIVMASPCKDLVMWASEEWMLYAALSRIKLSEKLVSSFSPLPVGEIMSITLGDNLSIETTKFSPKTWANGYNWKDYYNNSYTPPSTTTTVPPPAQTTALVPKTETPTGAAQLPEGWAVGTEIHFVAEEQYPSTFGKGGDGKVRIVGAVLEDTGSFIEAQGYVQNNKVWTKHREKEPVFKGRISSFVNRTSPRKDGQGMYNYLFLQVSDVKFVDEYENIKMSFEAEDYSDEELGVMLKDGCSFCGTVLLPSDVNSGFVFWDKNSPVCISCNAQVA